MAENNALQPMVNKFFEHDLENAVHILESMTEPKKQLIKYAYWQKNDFHPHMSTLLTMKAVSWVC